MNKNRSRATTLVLSSLLALVVIGGVIYAVSPTGQKEGQAAQTRNPDRLENILLNDSLTPEQRIQAALKEIEAQQPIAGQPDVLPNGQNEPHVSAPLWADPSFNRMMFTQDWDPFAEMQRMRTMTNDLFANMNHQLGMMGSQGLLSAQGPTPWTPSGDFTETDDAYVYRFDLPGVGQSQVTITTEDNLLTIEGHRESTIDETNQEPNGQPRVLRRELISGEFQRTMSLPPDVDEEGIQANMEDGVLTVTLPKQHQDTPHQPRVIDIK